MIVIDVLREDRLLEGMKCRKAVNLGSATVKCKEGSGPVVDKIVAEWATEAIAQAIPGLWQQIH